MMLKFLEEYAQDKYFYNRIILIFRSLVLLEEEDLMAGLFVPVETLMCQTKRYSSSSGCIIWRPCRKWYRPTDLPTDLPTYRRFIRTCCVYYQRDTTLILETTFFSEISLYLPNCTASHSKRRFPSYEGRRLTICTPFHLQGHASFPEESKEVIFLQKV